MGVSKLIHAIDDKLYLSEEESGDPVVSTYRRIVNVHATFTLTNGEQFRGYIDGMYPAAVSIDVLTPRSEWTGKTRVVPFRSILYIEYDEIAWLFAAADRMREETSELFSELFPKDDA